MYEYFVREVTKVVDGDTVDLVIDLGFSIMCSSRIRLAGIDAPESRTVDKEEKVLGLEAKKYLSERLKSAKKIVIKTEKLKDSDKYGRILGWLYLDGETTSVNNQMVKYGYAWQYSEDEKEKDLNELLKVRQEYEDV